MQITELIQQLAADALIELFELDLSVITGTNNVDDHVYFHAGTNELNQPVMWQTNIYQPFAVQAEGFDKTIKGSPPRPKMRAGNVSGILSALCKDLDDIVGAKLIRRRTFARYLDAGNFTGSVNPNADPNQFLPDDVFFVDRKITENKQMVEWELASAMDLQGLMLPARAIVRDFCPWEYRRWTGTAFDYTNAAECSYTGAGMFDANNNATSDSSKDVCSKSVSGCKARFGATAVLPFGGYPAARTYKV